MDDWWFWLSGFVNGYLYSMQIRVHRTVCMMVFMSRQSRLMSKYGDVCRPSACPGPRGQRAQDVGVELKMLVLSLSGFLHVTSCFCSTINLPVLDSQESLEIVFELGVIHMYSLVIFPFLIIPQKYRLGCSNGIFQIFPSKSKFA